MTTTTRRAPRAALMLVAAILTALPADAQYQTDLQQPLDANLQYGSGGMNPRAPRVDYSIRNNIITGNVTGLGYFRDEVGYRDPFEFGDVTSSDDLFRFRAESLAPAPAAYGPAADGPGPAAPGSFYSTFSDDPRQRRLPMGELPAGDSPVYREDSWQGYRIQPLRTAALDAPSRMSGTLNMQTMPDGRLLETTASPLLGLRFQVYDPARSLGLDDALPEDERDDLYGQPFEPGLTPPAPVMPGAVDVPALAPEQALPFGALSPTGSPSLDLGIYLDPDTVGMATDEDLARLERHIFRPLVGRQHQPGQDPYLDLLAQIRGGRGLALGEVGGDPQAERLPGEVEDIEATPVDVAPPQWPGAALYTPLTGFDVALPTEEELEAARQQREAAVQAAREALPSAFRDDPVAPMPGEAQEAPAEEPAGAVSLERVLESLNYDLPRLGSFAGREQTRLNAFLRQAEQSMVEGRYFDAEENYRLVLLAQPGHPMARVGQIHASLGAGLMDSAARQLRGLLEDHPELIATRYEARLLPSPQRLRWASGEIQTVIRLRNAPEPAILLAYVGYQLDQRPLIEYGMDLAQARSPLDPLNPVLRRIWLDENPRLRRASDQQGAAEPPVPPATPVPAAESEDTGTTK